jgi:hypothetical protein
MEFVGGPLDGRVMDVPQLSILSIPYEVEDDDGVHVRFVVYELRDGKYYHVAQREGEK